MTSAGVGGGQRPGQGYARDVWWRRVKHQCAGRRRAGTFSFLPPIGDTCSRAVAIGAGGRLVKCAVGERA